jgi:hypothetical protein
LAYEPQKDFEEVKMNFGSSQVTGKMASTGGGDSGTSDSKPVRRRNVNQTPKPIPFEDRGEWKMNNTKAVKNFGGYDRTSGELSFKAGKFGNQSYLQPGKVWVKKGSSYFSRLSLV